MTIVFPVLLFFCVVVWLSAWGAYIYFAFRVSSRYLDRSDEIAGLLRYVLQFMSASLFVVSVGHLLTTFVRDGIFQIFRLTAAVVSVAAEEKSELLSIGLAHLMNTQVYGAIVALPLPAIIWLTMALLYRSRMEPI